MAERPSPRFFSPETGRKSKKHYKYWENRKKDKKKNRKRSEKAFQIK